MANKRIIELDVTDVVEADDFLAIDSVSGTTRRIKPIKIGATYEIEDGDHNFTLVGSNGYRHTVDIPYDSVSMTQAEYDALTPAQKADGTARFITDGQSDVESELWSKVGRQTLDTDAQVLSNAVNELKGDIDTNTDAISQLESSLEYKTASNFYYLDISQPYTTIPNLSSYRNGICYVKSSSLAKWFGVPFDVANIVDTGLSSQIYVTSNIYIRDFAVVKASNRIEYDGVNGISDCFVCLYR